MGTARRQDAYGSPLTFSGGDSDTLMLALLRAAYAGRADTALAASVEQALPVQPSWLNFNRVRLRAERSVPLGAGMSAQLCAKGAARTLNQNFDRVLRSLHCSSNWRR